VFFFLAEDGIRDFHVTGVQTCALPIFDYDGLTSTRNYIFPDKSGTVALLDDIVASQTLQQVLDEGNTFESIGSTNGILGVNLGRSEERRVGKGSRCM